MRGFTSFKRTSSSVFNFIKNILLAPTSNATLNDGTLEMECDGRWRTSPGFVESLITGKWSKISWFNDVLRVIELERCKSNAPAAITDPAHQWFGDRAGDVVTLADRAVAIVGFGRNDEFRSAARITVCTAETTPTATAETKASVEAHAVRQIDEQLGAASARFRLFLGARSLVPFPSFVDESDTASSMQTEAKAARQLLAVISRVTPSMLQLGGGARADGGAAAGDDDDDGSDDDDNDGGGARGSHDDDDDDGGGAHGSHDSNAASDDDDDYDAPTPGKRLKRDPTALELGGSCTWSEDSRDMVLSVYRSHKASTTDYVCHVAQFCEDNDVSQERYC